MCAAGGLSRLPPRTLTTLLSVLAEAEQVESASPTTEAKQVESASPTTSVPRDEVVESASPTTSVPRDEVVESASPSPVDPSDERSLNHLFIQDAARHISQAVLSDYSWQDLSNGIQALSMQRLDPADAKARGLGALSMPTQEAGSSCRLTACEVIGEEALRRASAIINAVPSLGDDAGLARGMARNLASFAWAAAVGGHQDRGELVGGSLLEAFESLVCGLKPGGGEMEGVRADVRKYQQALLLSGEGGSDALQKLITGERDGQGGREFAVAGSDGDGGWGYGRGGGAVESLGGGVIVSSPFHKEVSREMRRLGINHENEVGYIR
jgi:hypothetical protein